MTAHTYEELTKKTVAELRDIAKDLRDGRKNALDYGLWKFT